MDMEPTSEIMARVRRVIMRTRLPEALTLRSELVTVSSPVMVNKQPTSTSSPPQPDSALVNILECPVCHEIPANEIFICKKGHSVCGTCRSLLVHCSLCTAPFQGSRNFVVESLISHFKKLRISMTPSTDTLWTNCAHKNEGCRKLILNSQVDAHEKMCEFRPVRCIVDNGTRCSQRTFLSLSEYFSHLLKQHKINGLSEPSGIFTKTDRVYMGLDMDIDWTPFYLQFDGKVFLRRASLRNGFVLWWIQVIGTESESRNYNATISLHSPKNPNIKVSWTVPVFSIRCEKKDIEEEDECNVAVISTTRILRFCSMNESFQDNVATHGWNWHITLNRLN